MCLSSLVIDALVYQQLKALLVLLYRRLLQEDSRLLSLLTDPDHIIWWVWLHTGSRVLHRCLIACPVFLLSRSGLSGLVLYAHIPPGQPLAGT